MTSGIHLVSVVTDAGQFWLHLSAFLHWHRNQGPVERFFVAYPEGESSPDAPAAIAALLDRVVRSAVPGLRTERRALPSAPDALLRQIDAWRAESAADAWVLLHPGEAPSPAWGLDGFLLAPGFRVLQRRPDGDWVLLARGGPDAEITAEPLPPIRRDETDEWAIADFVRAQSHDSPNPSTLTTLPAKPLPLLPLTLAALAAGWDWKQAFASAGADATAENDSQLFLRYLGAFLLDLGIRNVAIGTRRAKASAPTDPLLWINHGGRIWVVDAQLDASTASADTGPDGSSTLPPLASAILRAADARRDLGALRPEWILVRPCLALQPVEQSLAQSLGIRVLDELACRDLPAKIAAAFGLPLSPDAVEIERRLRTHLAESGRTRVFGREPEILLQQPASASDPVVVQADALLEQLQRARGQNWLLWTHDERIHLRVPSEGRSSAAGDWRAMLAAFVGLAPDTVRARPSARVLVLDFPETAEHRRRVADWLRPFLNASLTFDKARARFAAEARVSAEAENAGRSGPRSPAPSVASPGPGTGMPPSTGSPRGPRPASAPKPAPARPSPAAPPQNPAPRRMQRVSLEDLDRALDSALTTSPNPGTSDAGKP